LPEGLNLAACYDRGLFLDRLTAAFPHEREGIGKFYAELENVYDILSSLPAGSLEDIRHLLTVGSSFPMKTAALAIKTFQSMGKRARRHISDAALLHFIDIEAYSWALQMLFQLRLSMRVSVWLTVITEESTILSGGVGGDCKRPCRGI